MKSKLIPLAMLLLVVTAFAAPQVKDYVKTTTITATADTGTAITTRTDTTRLGACDGLTALIGDIRVSGPSTDIHGVGDSDICILVLKTRYLNRWFTIDSSRQLLPCSTWVSKVTNDTLFKRDLLLISVITDTTNDSNFTWTYNLNVNLRGLSK